jgi:serine O-acetyltransferase
MQSVTLGGTGKVSGDRHPKIRKGVLLGPGAKILGNIEVGEGAMVAASSVVLKAVPAHAVVAGVPAAVVGDTRCDEPSQAMDHYFKCD